MAGGGRPYLRRKSVTSLDWVSDPSRSRRFGELMAARIGGASAADPLFDLPSPTIPLLRDRPWFLPLVGGYYRVKDWLG